MAEEKQTTTVAPKTKPVIAQKSRQQRVREVAVEIYTKFMTYRTKELYDEMMKEKEAARKENRAPESLSTFRETYTQASYEASDMSIVAAASFDAVWERVKGKYKEQEE
jgi:hypothetical protein